MKKIFLTLTILSTMIVTSGCAIFTPYSENFVCNVPPGQGYCGSVTDGFEYSVKYNK